MMEEFITTLLVNAAVFSVLFGILVLVHRLLGKRLSAVWQYALWMVVLVKLVIPFGWESAWSPMGWFTRPPDPAAVVEEIVADPVTGPMPVIDPLITPDNGEPAVVQEAGIPEMPSVNNETAAPLAARSLTWAEWAMIIWGAGAAVTAGWLLLCLYHVRGRLLRRRSQVPISVQRVFAACRQELGIRRRISIRMQAAISVPAITGVLRPVLILPANLETGDEETLRHIILHELTHYKNGDLVMIQIMNVLNVLYWFNPLVWLCFRLMRKDMETICDQRVLGMTARERQSGYVAMLLRFASATPGRRMCAAMSVNDGRADMEERIRNMCRRRRMGRGMKAAVILIAVLMLAGGVLTACRPATGTGESVGAGTQLVGESEEGQEGESAMAEELEPTSVPEDTQVEDDQNAVTTPVLIRGALVGGLIQGEWLDADAFYKSGAVDFDGYRYDVYGDDKFMGEALGGPLMSFQTGERLELDGDVYDSYVDLYGDDGQEVPFDIALQGDWDLYPRTYTGQDTDPEEYLALAKSLLAQEGLADPVTYLHQVVTVDLDGDGTSEVLIAADHTMTGDEYPETKKGDNAILIFRRMNGEQAIDQTVDAYIVPEDPEYLTNYRIHFSVMSCADLDGDGCLEVIAWRYNAWGVEYNVYKLAGDQLVRVASHDLGV